MVNGCELRLRIDVPRGSSDIRVHVTSPFIPILSAGKLPNLSVFSEEISEAIRLAFNRDRQRLPPDPSEPKPPPKEVTPRPVPAGPTGTLGKRIAAEVAAGTGALDELTVLSVTNDPYRLDNENGHKNGKWFADQVKRG